LFVSKGKMMDIWKSFTPQFFDTLVIVVIIIGLALAVVRLYADFTRKLPPESNTMAETGGNTDGVSDDTQPTKAIQTDDKNTPS
jgi:hypothetical protein